MIPLQLYHIFNRGNNRQPIFFKEKNYFFFLAKAKSCFLKHGDFVAYCLMPDHFHFLFYTSENFRPDYFTNDFRVMLSSYTRAINIQEGRVGSLFQQHSKFKLVDEPAYGTACFHYIHQNPIRAGLVDKMEKWDYSSFNDYYFKRNGLVNSSLAYQLLDIPDNPEQFYSLSYTVKIFDESSYDFKS
ncbi:MAG: transposase [Flammeovirgaceae bacterium]|nr:MAG: transposase [Flammeovirgaceae bacterium]